MTIRDKIERDYERFQRASGRIDTVLRKHPSRVAKAHTATASEPKPWEFEPTERGLAGLLHSPEMLELEETCPAAWREAYLNFFAAMEPRPLPQEISAKRLELLATHPDDPAQATLAKALTEGARLTHGQSVLVNNFGRELGDPSVWMKR